MLELCDLAYVVQVERLEHQAAALAGALAPGAGEDLLGLAEQVQLQMRLQFDEALAAEPKPLSRSEQIRRRLGVA